MWALWLLLLQQDWPQKNGHFDSSRADGFKAEHINPSYPVRDKSVLFKFYFNLAAAVLFAIFGKGVHFLTILLYIKHKSHIVLFCVNEIVTLPLRENVLFKNVTENSVC